MSDDQHSGRSFLRFLKGAGVVVVCGIVGVPLLAFAGFVIYALLTSFHA